MRTCFLFGFVLSVVAPRAALAAGPQVRSLLPEGGQRGTTVEVAAAGNFAIWPPQAWVDRAGLSVAPLADKGKLSATIAADAPCGLYWIRLFDAEGASAPQPFIVGTLGEVLEQEPNNSPQKAQPLAAPAVVVNGRLAANGDVDTFAVTLKKGQTLVASLEAHETLGSPVDSVLQIVAPAGNVLAFNHDQRGLDPQIVFDAPADGSFLVRIFGFPSTPNQTIGFAGNDQMVYRLTLTTGPLVDYPWPLAVTRERETQVELLGWNVPNSIRSLVVRPSGERMDLFDPQLANATGLVVEPHETLAEIEPNDAQAMSVVLPMTVSGRIETERDVDLYGFAGKKGESLTFELQSRSLGYPLDGVLQVTDAAGKSLVRVDDVGNGRDPLVTFSPPDDGQYTIAVRDLTGQGSSRHVYLLRATKTVPDFEVTADSHAYVATIGKPLDITLSIARRNGFDGEIAFTVTGLPESIKAAPGVSTATGDAAKSVKLTLTAGAEAFNGPIQIIAASSGATKIERTVGAVLAPRASRSRNLWLTVAPEKAK